ncbi:unnamed protein product [Pseudo-nitzschia multistriata]|uniref:DNA-directed RNA polymerase RBP11-like dimerisation domain-containing protein n=1 Tax=Pseudo-nitzschia multistriata TaxID=183589 RepID=A0A448ZP37_9STRA|nr:unnamed protein product [Pseudo-nitzschia multistriata]
MSVNEVRVKRVDDSKKFQVKGTGPESNRTFAIGNEDHTLGNALRHILIQNSKVEFAGYSVPHPSEPIVHIRVQTHQPTTALQALQESCETLNSQCEYVLQQLEEKLPEVTADSIALQAKLAEMLEDDEEEGDEEDVCMEE